MLSTFKMHWHLLRSNGWQRLVNHAPPIYMFYCTIVWVTFNHTWMGVGCRVWIISWSPTFNYVHKGSIVWNWVKVSWCKLQPELASIQPKTLEEVGCESFWWSSFVTAIGPSFSKTRASQLHRKGLMLLQDIYKERRFFSVAEHLVSLKVKQVLGRLPWEVFRTIGAKF